MIEAKLVAVLRCPETGQKLQIAEKSLIQRVNAAIRDGRVRDHQDQKVETAFDGGLVTIDQKRLFPIRDQIPSMILGESILLSPLGETTG
jgi:uncharacterized protein YbaR (Trm112 family)